MRTERPQHVVTGQRKMRGTSVLITFKAQQGLTQNT